VRLALLGPCDGDVAALARAARTALVELAVDRAIYLGTDDALDAVAFAWAEALGVLDPLEARVDELLAADPDTIDAAVAGEQLRARLSTLRALAGPGLRTVEILHDRVLLLVDDKRELDEEDLLPASFIVFGRGEPLIRRVGSRVFFCPGSPARRTEGLLVLDEGQAPGSVLATIHAIDGEVVQREVLDTSRALKMKVQGT
jgi:hypothetical protein